VRVLVTGATGIVGFEALEQLRALEGVEAVGASRHGSETIPDVVAWDIGAQEPPAELRREWDVIVHTAASTRWTMELSEAYSANVESVEALLPLVSPETHVVHISTAYAVGLRGNTDSTEREDYRNSYEWSKAHAERLARDLFPRLTIVRPPLVIGRRGDGRAARFAGLYTVLRGMASSMVPAVVAVPDAYLDVVPADDLALLIVEAARGEGTGEVLSIGGGANAPRVEPILTLMTDSLNEWRAARELEPFDPAKLVSPSSWERFFLPFARDHLSPRQMRILELLSNFQPYLGIAEPLSPTHSVGGVEACVSASVHYWADRNERLASLSLRPWTAAA
jgi:nucleoside-diphosphate-sugar epimerase